MDRPTKVIFAFIAAGLWANAVTTLIQPAHAQAKEQAEWLGRIALQAQSIAGDLRALASGGVGCTNPKLCK
jgi:hypothetical protein